MATKEALLEELEIIKAENARLKHHNNYFISSEQIDFDSFEESNQNLHELFDSARDLIQVFSLDEKLLFANARAVEVLNYPKNKIDDFSLAKILAPRDLEYIRKQLTETKKGAQTPKIDTSFFNSNGQEIPVTGNFNCIFEKGKPVGYTAIFFDNSDKVRAEKAQKLYYQIANLSIEKDNLEDLLEEIHHLLREHIFANNFHVALLNEEQDVLTFPYNVDENFGGRIRSYNRKFGKGLSELTILRQKSQFLYEEDIYNLVNEGHIEPYGSVPKVWLGVPLRLDKNIIGVISLKSHSDRDKYSIQDLELLDFISGQIALVIGRRQYEDQLEEKQAKLNAILESTQHIIWTVDRNHFLTSFNNNYANEVRNTFKFDLRESLLGKIKRFQLEDAYFEEYVKDQYQKAFEGNNQHFETMSESQDGKTIWRETYLSPIYLPTGRIEEVSGISHDITEKKLQELTVQESEEKFRNIFESFQDIYFRTDINGRITLISPSVKEVTGYTPSELSGKSILSFYNKKDDHENVVRQLLEEGKVQNYEATISTKKNEQLHSIANLKLILSANGRPIGFDGVVRDITYLQNAAEELKAARDLAEHSLQVKDQFLANMSHEIRTPMNGLVAMIDLLIDTRLSDEQEDYVNTIKNSSEVLLDLLNDILDLAKLQAGKMELHKSPVSIINTFEKIEALFSQKARAKGLKFEYEVDTRITNQYDIDETRLIQVLANLTSNSIKFTDDGSVKISALHVAQQKENTTIQFRVEDTGIGIAQTDIKKLFNDFHQLDNSTTKAYAGTGLGLSISQELVELMGGNIKVESELDEGSQFYFSFPVKTSTKQHTDTTPAPFKISDHHFTEKQPYILVVDDNSVNRKVARAILLKGGCKVRSAKNGYEAIETVQKNNFDIVFMDIQMPELDGLTAMQRIHEFSNDDCCPIIAMTAYSLSEDKENFIKAGFDDYISKPITAKKLLSMVKTHLNIPEKSDQPTEITATLSPIINQVIWQKLEEIGGIDMVKELFEEFITTAASDLKECQDSSTPRDLIHRHIHTLKGTAATIGASKLADLAKEIESQLKKGKFSNFSKEFAPLVAAFDQLKTTYKNKINAQ